jgi:molybdopterin adenylyltransferase
MLAILVITCSDRASRGEYQDLSGAEIVRLLREFKSEWKVEKILIPDDRELLRAQLIEGAARHDVIITSGGTGIGPRDITPDVTRDLCDRDLPGLAEMLRMKSLEQTPFAVFSRGFAGVLGQTIVINLPGSLKAARFCTEQLLPLLEHGRGMLSGDGH